MIATPIGVGSAIYLNEYAKPGKIIRIIEFTTETLSGIPSIIFGLFGSVFFGTTLKLGYSLLTGALTLCLDHGHWLRMGLDQERPCRRKLAH